MSKKLRAFLTGCVACKSTRFTLFTLVRKSKENPAVMICSYCRKELFTEGKIKVEQKGKVEGTIFMDKTTMELRYKPELGEDKQQ